MKTTPRQPEALQGCRAKLARARRHLDELLESIQSWGQPSPYAIDTSFDETTHEYVLTVSANRAAPVEEWGAAIGDVLHNLHSTLDSLICTMIRKTKPKHDCRGKGFPILDRRQSWDRKKKSRLDPRSGLGQLTELDEWARATIKSLQPFNVSEADRRRDALWLLRELSNADKHRAIHVSSFFLYEPEIVFDPPESGEVTWARAAGPFRDGDEVLRFRTRPPKAINLHLEGTKLSWDIPKSHRSVQMGADLVFDDGPPAYGAKVDVLLEWLCRYVTWVVDLFDHKYFGGDAPEGTRRTVIRATHSATVTEGED